MVNVKSVSDLTNYNEVLQDIDIGQPVFLSVNGQERYAIMDLREYEKNQATIKLMSELTKGEISGQKNNWLTEDEVRKNIGLI